MAAPFKVSHGETRDQQEETRRLMIMTDSEELDFFLHIVPPSQVSSVRLRMPPQRTKTSLGSAHDRDEHGKQTQTHTAAAAAEVEKMFH